MVIRLPPMRLLFVRILRIVRVAYSVDVESLAA
jgi:hypothetical protein